MYYQPVFSNECKVSGSRKQRKPITGLELTPDRLQVRHTTHCAKKPLYLHFLIFKKISDEKIFF